MYRLILTGFILALSLKFSVTQSNDEDLPLSCSDQLDICKDDFANSGELRNDQLLLIKCLKSANCDGNDDDIALRDREIFIAKYNDLHFSPVDDKEGGSNPTSVASALIMLTLCLLALFVL